MGVLTEARLTSSSVQFIGTDGHGAKRTVLVHKNDCEPLFNWAKVQLACGKPGSQVYADIKLMLNRATEKLCVKQTSDQYWRIYTKA